MNFMKSNLDLKIEAMERRANFVPAVFSMGIIVMFILMIFHGCENEPRDYRYPVTHINK